MRNSVQRVFAVICGVVTVGMPAVAAAEVPCPTYFQVKSNATGGEYVGGLLYSESSKTVSLESEKITTTSVSASAETEVKYPVGSVSGGGSLTSTTVEKETYTVTGDYNVGVYKMNDGTTWLVNCDIGAQLAQVA